MNTRKLAFASILVGVLTLGALPAQAGGDGCRPRSRSGISFRIGWSGPSYVVRSHYGHRSGGGWHGNRGYGGHHGSRYGSHYGSRRGWGRCR